MRKPVTFLMLLLFALLVQTMVRAQAPTQPVMRVVNVRSIYVDRASFKITWTSCGTKVGGIFLPCGQANVKREVFLDALERWLEKYGIKMAAAADSADAVLRGSIHMDDDMAAKDRDFEREKRRRGKDEIVSRENYEEDWSVTAWLENRAGDEIWRSGGYYPKPGYGWSSIGKIEGKELAKEIQYNIKKKR